MIVLGQCVCSPAKVVVFGKVDVVGQKWLYSSKVVYSGKSGCIPQK